MDRHSRQYLLGASLPKVQFEKVFDFLEGRLWERFSLFRRFLPSSMHYVVLYQK